MPVDISGVRETLNAIKKFDPEALKAMNKEVKAAMIPIRNNARGFIPSPYPGRIYNWEDKGRERVQKTFNTEGRVRLFPLFNAEVAKAGIVYRQGRNQRSNKGWRASFYIANISAAGAIYETAGRKNPGGDPASKSNNPNAGADFIASMGPLYGSGKERGRAIFKAWEQDQGRAHAAVIRAIDKTVKAFNKGAYDLAA